MSKVWWKESVVYQIYPRSFKDTNNDGIGDINGIIQKIDYIKALGVDVIWLCPIYKSPNNDNGYDISDYTTIMPEFGSMDDFDELLRVAHDRGIKIILDLVVNHTSDEHPWFRASKKSKNSPFRDYYYWRKGNNGCAPNNWQSFFKGSVWEPDQNTGEYYLHLFSKKQPDLNWENPTVRREVYKLMKFWLDKGIDGFRMDVIPLISKDISFPDTDYQDFYDVIENVYANGPRVHEFLREMYEEVISKYDIMTVGEGPGITPDIANLYVGHDRKELNMIFHFGHLYLGSGKNGKYDAVPWKLPEFKNIFKVWDKAVGGRGWNSIFLGNHDFARIVSRFGNDTQYRKESAKLLAMLLLSMRGTVFLYQGDEIGMTNVAFPSIDDYNDIETISSYKEAEMAGKNMGEFLSLIHDQSRDNARTPMQWDQSENGGFSKTIPWLKCNPNHKLINVGESESDPDSILHFYRKMIKFRKDHDLLVYGEFHPLMEEDPDLFVYERYDNQDKMLVILNFSNSKRSLTSNIEGLKSATCLMSNYKEQISPESNTFYLRPWEGNIFKI